MAAMFSGCPGPPNEDKERVATNEMSQPSEMSLKAKDRVAAVRPNQLSLTSRTMGSLPEDLTTPPPPTPPLLASIRISSQHLRHPRRYPRRSCAHRLHLDLAAAQPKRKGGYPPVYATSGGCCRSTLLAGRSYRRHSHRNFRLLTRPSQDPRTSSPKDQRLPILR